MILAHSEGEMPWFRAGGVAVYNYAFEVVILAHSEGEMGGVVVAVIICPGGLIISAAVLFEPVSYSTTYVIAH